MRRKFETTIRVRLTRDQAEKVRTAALALRVTVSDVVRAALSPLFSLTHREITINAIVGSVRQAERRRLEMREAKKAAKKAQKALLNQQDRLLPPPVDN